MNSSRGGQTLNGKIFWKILGYEDQYFFQKRDLIIYKVVEEVLPVFYLIVTYVAQTRVQMLDTGMCPTRVLLNFCKFFH